MYSSTPGTPTAVANLGRCISINSSESSSCPVASGTVLASFFSKIEKFHQLGDVVFPYSGGVARFIGLVAFGLGNGPGPLHLLVQKVLVST